MPQLNTSGNNILDTMQQIKSLNIMDEQIKAKKSQNKLLDLQLSPAMQATIKADRELARKTANAVLKNKQLENERIAGENVRDALGDVYNRIDTEGIQAYRGLYNRAMENELTKNYAASLPNPDAFEQEDISVPSGQTITKNYRKELKAVIANLMTAADRKAQGLDNEYRDVYLPDSKQTVSVLVPKTGAPGEVLNPAEFMGIPGAVWATDSPTFKSKKVIVGGKTVYAEDDPSIVGKEAPPDPNIIPAAQAARLAQADQKALADRDQEFLDTDKDGLPPEFVFDREAGSGKANQYNSLANKLNESTRFVWDPEAYQEVVEDEESTGLAGLPKRWLKGAKDIILGKDTNTKPAGAWVKQSVDDITKEAVRIAERGGDIKAINKRLKELNIDIELVASDK